ncbi:hypothetical protein MRB53_020910 [Persea americana]|uniref:Uncharacterized protein n=1 Tax=Persea americana TaxID=3435 RepID=A0ACC2L2J9_PERAE|nr:hypothetical protein MRB53_020910 [Persea americana]
MKKFFAAVYFLFFLLLFFYVHEDSADDGSCHERLTSREECIPKRCISFCRESHEGSFAYCNETLPSICECWYPCSRLIRRQRERSI